MRAGFVSKSKKKSKALIHSGHKHDIRGTVHIQNIAANGSL